MVPLIKQKLKIYLADLIHDYFSSAESYYIIPLNIGFISSYAKRELGEEINVELFKYPKQLINAFEKNNFPDVLGFSFYTWNEELVLHLAKEVKLRSPSTLIVFGGPNVEGSEAGLKAFLETHRYVDFYIPFEGEEVFTNLIKLFISLDKNIKELKNSNIAGAATISETFKYSLVKMKEKSRKINYPSPYQTGVLDEFLADPYLYPLFETNRGCPFSCTFCTWGVSVLNYLREWDIEQVKGDFEYFLKHNSFQSMWMMADANFGILERDVETAKWLAGYSKLPNGPKSLLAWNSKNSIKRNIEIQEILGNLSGFLVAFQTLDNEVLKNIKRDNIRLEDMEGLLEYFKKVDASPETDILIGLPGETMEKHLATLRKCFDYDIRYIRGMNIRLLDGSEMASPESIKKYGIKYKYRLIRDSYGKYFEDWVIDSEKIIRSTNTLSEGEMDRIRVIHFFIWLFWNQKVLTPLLVFGATKRVNPLDQILFLLEKNNMSVKFSKIIKNYLEDAQKEYFNSKDEIKEFYLKSNTSTLLDKFNNLNFIYTPKLIFDTDVFKEIVGKISGFIETQLSSNTEKEHLREITQFALQRVCINPFNCEKTKTFALDSDIIRFLQKEKVLTRKSIEMGDESKEIRFNLDIGDLNFIKDALSSYNQENVRFGKVVTAKFIRSLIYA